MMSCVLCPRARAGFPERLALLAALFLLAVVCCGLLSGCTRPRRNRNIKKIQRFRDSHMMTLVSEIEIDAQEIEIENRSAAPTSGKSSDFGG